MKDGKGEQAWTDGSLYQGYWTKGLMQGKGRMIEKTLDYYEGNFD